MVRVGEVDMVKVLKEEEKDMMGGIYAPRNILIHNEAFVPALTHGQHKCLAQHP